MLLASAQLQAVTIPYCANGADPATATITSVTPSYWEAGKTFNITITGTNFISDCLAISGEVWDTTQVAVGTAGLSDANVVPFTIPKETNVTVNPATQTITATVTTDANDTAGPVCVFVTQYELGWIGVAALDAVAKRGIDRESNAITPHVTSTNACATKVNINPNVIYTAHVVPTVTSITPKAIWAGQSTIVTITGTGFTPTSMSTAASPATTLTATVPSGSVTLSSYTIDSPTQITAVVELSADAPAEKVTYTITNPAPTNGSSSVRSNAAALSPVVMITDDALPVPILYQNGTQVTDDHGNSNGSSALNVVVGQPISLTTQLTAPIDGDYPITSTTWTAGGTLFTAWSADLTGTQSTPFDPSNLTKPSLNFFWSNPGTSPSPTYPVTVPVTYQYCVSAPVTNPCSIVATADFVVKGPNALQEFTCSADFLPSGCTANAELASVDIEQPFLEFGNISAFFSKKIKDINPIVGIGITAKDDGTAPPGAYYYAQKVKNWNRNYTFENANGVPCPVATDLSGLDGQWPIRQGSKTSMYDSPGSVLFNDDAEVTESFEATTYLLWKADAANSNYVPLGSLIWQWTGDALFGSLGWTTNPKTTSQGSVVQAFEPSTTYPTWNGFVLDPQVHPCIH